VHIPTTFAFDFSSPLKKYLPANYELNPGQGFTSDIDFFNYPEDNILSDLYRYEFSNHKVPKSFTQRSDDPHLVNKDHLKLMLENAFTIPRNAQKNSTMKDSVGEYIMRKFGTLGLLTGTQVFTPSQLHNLFWPNMAVKDIPHGSNIIGIYPGKYYSTSKDKIIVVGAHWDTLGTTDGFNDNGSGVAATIETVRALVESNCQLKYTVLFVAFDKEENGSQGSHEFVRGYLVKHFQENNWPEFQGAIIMDTLLNYNATENSQFVPHDWKKEAPHTYDAIKEDGFKGNFLSIVYRSAGEEEMAGILRKHNADLKDDKLFSDNVAGNNARYKYREFPISLASEPPSIRKLSQYIQFLRSDHGRFWYSRESTYSLSLRAVLLTDMGPYRGLMKDCYHKACDSKRGRHGGHFANYDFFAKTVQTVVDAVTDMAGAVCTKSKRASELPRYSEQEEDSSWDTLQINPVKPTNSVLSVLGLIDDEENSIEEDDVSLGRKEGDFNSIVPQPVTSAAQGTRGMMNSGVRHLANTAVYITHYFKWVPTLFISG